MWRRFGSGFAPPHYRFGRAIRYSTADLDRWAAARKVG
jgi:hypothetical protein